MKYVVLIDLLTYSLQQIGAREPIAANISGLGINRDQDSFCQLLLPIGLIIYVLMITLNSIYYGTITGRLQISKRIK